MTDEGEQLFLIHFELADPSDLPELDLHGDGRALSDDLFLVYSALSQSKLYHRIKWQLPGDTPVIVARLDEAPKFKGMADGALKWLRERSGRA